MQKEKLTRMLIEGFEAGKMRNLGKRENKGAVFQRDKEEMIREILIFHEQKIS